LPHNIDSFLKILCLKSIYLNYISVLGSRRETCGCCRLRRETGSWRNSRRRSDAAWTAATTAPTTTITTTTTMPALRMRRPRVRRRWW
jgi:hypothetical protein